MSTYALPNILRMVSFLSLALAGIFPALPVPAADDPVLEPYFVANAAYNRKLYPVAVSQYREFLQKHGNHPKADLARRGLALSLYALKQYDKAMPEFAALLAKPSLEKSINRERLIMLQSQCMLSSGKHEEARKLFIEQLRNLRQPTFRHAAMAAISDVSFARSEWDKVVEWTAKLVAAKPSADQAARAYYQNGFAYYRLDKPKEAVAPLSKVAALDTLPEWNTRAAYLQGECHSLLKEIEKAEPAFAAALPGMPGKDGDECQYRLAITRFLLGKHEMAQADFQAYLKRAKPDKDGKPAPYVEDARYYVARCTLELEDFNQADRQFSSIARAEGKFAAKANLWWARAHTRREKPNYDRAAQILADAVKRFNNKPEIDELDFDYANALIGSSKPDWKTAQNALARVEGRRKFGQMAEVVAQRATSLHKLKDYNSSLRSTDLFIANHKSHELLGDTRFLRGENLYLLNRGDEAAKAYTEFIQHHKAHGNVFAAKMRIAQIHHNAKRWPQALAVSGPLLAQQPEGRLFTQLAFVVGDCYFRQEKWKESTGPLEAFVDERVTVPRPNQRKVQVGPNLDTALIQLAVAYDRLGDKEKALHHLLTLTDYYRAQEQTPHLPLALSEQGRLAYQAGDLGRARTALERFLAEDKQNKDPFRSSAPSQRSRVHYYLGWVHATESRHVPAAESFAKVPHNDPLGPDAALQRGIALIHAENFEEAYRHFPQMLNRFREHEKLPLMVYYCGLSASKREDWGNACNYFKRVLDNHAKSEFADQALYEWAWAERERKRNKEATALYERLLKDYPSSHLVVKVQSEMAELNLDSGAQEKVIAELTATLKGVEDEKLREPIRIQLASAHYKKGDNELAATMFEKLLEDYPESTLRASMYFQAGEARFRLKETAVARDHFQAAYKIPPKDPELAETVTMRLGETQSLTGEYKSSVNTYRDFLRRFPESKWLRIAQFGHGYALENSDKPKEAINEYRKLYADLKKVDIWTVRARFQTGECYFNMQQYEQAIAEFVNVEINFKRYPDWQAKSVLEIARVLLAQEKKEEAVQRFKDVITRYGKEKSAVVARQYLDQLRSG